MPPFGKAVRLIDDPATDFPLLQHRENGWTTQLLGRDQNDRGIAKANSVQRVVTFWQGKHAVDREAGRNALTPEPVDLIRHERHERGNDNRQRTRLLVARESGKLVADGLAGAGWQNADLALAGERIRDDLTLQRLPSRTCRFGSEPLKAEPAAQQQVRIVLFATPTARRIPAGAVTQLSHELGRADEPVSYPWRHDQITPGYRNP